MIGLQSSLPLLAAWLAVPLFFLVLFVVFVTIKYSPIVSRYFQAAAAVLAAARRAPATRARRSISPTDDGLRLGGTYFRAGRPSKPG